MSGFIDYYKSVHGFEPDRNGMVYLEMLNLWNHQQAKIDKLIKIAHCDCEFLANCDAPLPCNACQIVKEVKEM